MSGDNGHIEQRAVDEESLNSAIDAVAREMTGGEPSGALRGRVLERMESERRRSSPGVPRWVWAGAAAAVVLAVATAVWVGRPVSAPHEARATTSGEWSAVPSPASPGPERAAAQSPVPAVGAAAPDVAPAVAVRTSRAAATQGARPAGNEAAADFNAVPALAEIEPLRFAAVEPAPLHIADVEITQITEMPSIEIQSLDSGSHDIQTADPKKEK